MSIIIPSSKSLAHRYLIAAAFSKTPCKVKVRGGWSEDLKATKRTLKAILSGAKTADVGNSATTLRLLEPLARCLGWKGEFELGEQLAKRPRIFFTLKRKYVLEAQISSQFLSGLLIAQKFGGLKANIEVKGKIPSQGYAEMTRRVLDEADRLPRELMVEGDWSSAAAFLALARAKHVELQLKGLNPTSLQPDRVIVDYLKQMPRRIEVTDTPDIYPVLRVYAEFAELPYPVRFTGTRRLRYKECDRVKATEELIAAVKRGETVKAYGDHRIAMAAALAAALADRELKLDDYGCVKKSYPNFWRDWEWTLDKVKATNSSTASYFQR